MCARSCSLRLSRLSRQFAPSIARRARGGVDDDAARAMAPADASLVRSSDDGSGESDDDDDADVLQPWVKRRRYAAVAAPSRATRAERAVRERVVAAMRDRTITRDDAPEEEAREEETREEETREEPPTLSRNENNQWSFRESVPVFESNDDVVAKLRARAREMSEREKRSLILRARAEREEARAETFNVSAAVGAAEREKRRERW